MELSAEASLEPDEVRAVLKGDDYADSVEADQRQARDYGASGVPFFVIDRRYGISGAQPTETCAGALGQAWADSTHPD